MAPQWIVPDFYSFTFTWFHIPTKFHLRLRPHLSPRRHDRGSLTSLRPTRGSL